MGKSLFFNLLLVILLVDLFGCSKKDIDTGFDLKGEGPIPEGDYYVAPWGNDDSAGTFEQPWGTWQKAFETAKPGDIVYFRGGVWYPTTVYYGTSGIVYINPYDTPHVGYDGTAENPICMFAYPGETPVLDCKNVKVPVNFLSAIEINRANYWSIKGLTITNVLQSKEATVHGFITGGCSNLTVENITVTNIGGKGIVNYNAFKNAIYPEQAKINVDTTKYINCDASYCMDSKGRLPGLTDFGNYADGFWLNVENPVSYVKIQGCRSWMNSDDGFDLPTAGVIVMKNCWAFNNGHLAEGAGQGIRNDPARNILPWTISNCISAFNKYGGFTVGYNSDSSRPVNFYNNISYHQKYGLLVAQHIGETRLKDFHNNIFYDNNTFDLLLSDPTLTHSNNFWGAKVELLNHDFEIPDHSPAVTVTDADFVSLDVNELLRPRNADHSLPDVDFLKLAPGSDLIDAGINVGLPFSGSAPDMGAFEVE